MFNLKIVTAICLVLCLFLTGCNKEHNTNECTKENTCKVE